MVVVETVVSGQTSGRVLQTSKGGMVEEGGDPGLVEKMVVVEDGGGGVSGAC